MPRIARQNLRLFGNDGSTPNFAQWGSQRAGSPVNTKNIETIQNLTAWLQGIQDEVNDSNKAPFMEDWNSLLYVFCYQIFYMLEQGIPEWYAATTYYVGSVVRKPNTFELYGSLTDNNTGNALPSLTDNSNWELLFPVRASKILGTLTESQIASVAASVITGQVANAQISSLAASKLTGLIVNAQISDVAASKLTGLVQNAQIQSLDAAKLTGSIPVSDGSVTRAKLSTGTGFVSGPGGVFVPVTMNDYNFFPSIETFVGLDGLTTFASPDSGDTVGRFGKGNSQLYHIRWRYVSASDDPRMWAIVDKDGKLLDVWESEDPPNHGDVAEEGADELCPFPAEGPHLEDGRKIVRIPIPEVDEIKTFMDKLPEKVGAVCRSRWSRKFERKGWVDQKTLTGAGSQREIISAVPQRKRRMGAQWMLRSLAGRQNVAGFIRNICEYSPKDGRLVLPAKNADKIGLDGALAKETK